MSKDRFAEIKDKLSQSGFRATNDDLEFLVKLVGRLDGNQNVQMMRQVRAGPFQMGAYKVFNPISEDWSELQFHMTYDNYVCAVLSSSEAMLFSNFILKTCELQSPQHEQDGDK